MKTFDALLSCNFPINAYPLLLDVKNVPVDFWPYGGIADNEEAAKAALLAYLAFDEPADYWWQEEKLSGVYQAKIEILDHGDYFFLKVMKETVNPIKLEWLPEDVQHATDNT
jgi:hypothetical protein